MSELPELDFAGLLRRLRSEARLTQEELAEAAGLSPRTISDLERGINRRAHKDTAGQLADALSLVEPARGLFVAAARGRVPAASVLGDTDPDLPHGVISRAQSRARTSAPGTVSQPRAPFVGRDSELALMSRALSGARTGHGRFVLLAGEPGIGKTRLAHCLADEARRLGLPTWWGRAWEEDGAPGFWPLIQIGRSVIQGTNPDRLRRVIGRDAPLVAQLLPELYGEEAEIRTALTRDAAESRFRLFDAIARLLAEAAADSGALIVLDDLHAADEPSLHLLRFLARQVPKTRLLVLCTYRDTGSGGVRLAGLLADVAREPANQRLHLSSLSRVEVGQLIEIITGKPVAIEVSAAVYSRTGGNPFFTGELVRLMHSESELDNLAAAAALIPPTVADVVRGRVNALSETSQQVLVAACVIGPDFDLELLSAAMQLPVDVVLQALDETAAAGLTVAGALPGHQHAFAHALVRDALYDHLGVAERARLHEQIGTTLEEVNQDDLGPHLAEIASHFLRAAPDQRPKALKYTVRAGEYEVGRFAYEQAEHLFALAGVEGPSEAAFEEFVLGSRADMFRAAFLMTGDRGVAENMVQSALERTYQHWRRVAAAGNPDAYARRVLVNLANHQWRSRRHTIDEAPDTTVAGADYQTKEAETRDPVFRTLLAMPGRMRTVLVLRYFEQLSEAETAAAMGSSVGAVQSHASRGLAKLRAAMAQDLAAAGTSTRSTP